MSKEVDAIRSLVEGIVYDKTTGFMEGKSPDYLEGQHDIAKRVLEILNDRSVNYIDRRPSIDHIASEILSELEVRGFDVVLQPSNTTISRYVRFKDDTYPTIRVSDHRSKSSKTKVEIGTHFPKSFKSTGKNKYGEVTSRHFFAARDIDRLVQHYEDLRSWHRTANGYSTVDFEKRKARLTPKYLKTRREIDES